MAYLSLTMRLGLELPKINAALTRATKRLPAPVQPIAEHIFSAGGKRLRPFLTILTAELFGCKDSRIHDLAISLEMLHAATLLHDDVIDQADVRRGKPAAHTIFSPTSTILAGDAMLACGNAIVADFDNPKLSRVFSEATAETCAGEITEIAFLRNVELSYEQYLAILCGKTAKLISAACEMGALVANAPKDAVAHAACFGQNVGIAFQLVDDALDFAQEEVTGKPQGGDLREGKLTLPLRYYREMLSEEERKAFDTAFVQGSFSQEDCARISKEVCSAGLDVKARSAATDYLTKAEAHLASLPDVSERKLLCAMTAYVQDRKK